MAEIRVLLLDNRPLVRMGLQSMLSGQPDLTVVGSADGLADVAELALRTRPTVVLVSVHNGGPRPAETVAALGPVDPPPRVLVLSGHLDEDAHHAAAAGVSGFVLEHLDGRALLAAVRAVAAGYVVLPALPGEVAPGTAPAGAASNGLQLLTQREFDVFELIAQGRSNAEIAETLQLTRSTVKSHVRSLLGKLGLRNRVEAAIYAHELARARPPLPRGAGELAQPGAQVVGGGVAAPAGVDEAEQWAGRRGGHEGHHHHQ